MPHWLGLVVLLAVVGGFALWDSIVRSRHLLEVTASYGVTVDPPAVDPGSPTGYADGRRSLVLPASAADTEHWIMQTQAMLATGDGRTRHVTYDNAPDGREVHWAAPLHWWLALQAWADHLLSGRPVGVSVERAALLAGPVMLALILTGLVPWLYGKFSPAAAVLVTVGLVAFHPIYIDFLPGRADHHALLNLCGLLTVLGLLLGSAETTPRAARRWFVASALAGGAGLWISAATQAPVLVGVGLGVLAAGLAGRDEPKRLAWMEDPGLFRTWGLVGGGVSVAAYLLEYFPSHLGMRLEVNHPLYAAAWIGAGESLRVALLMLRDGPRALSRPARVTGATGFALMVLLPAVIAITGAKTFTVSDPFVWRLHSLYIYEFQGLTRGLVDRGLSWDWLALCLPMLLLLPAGWLAFRRSTPPRVKAQLALVLLPALLGWAMGWYQVRWLGLAFALSMPAIALFFRILESPGGRPRGSVPVWTAACGLLFLPGAMMAVQRTLAAGDFTVEEIRQLAERDVAHWLRLRGGGERVVVAATPTPTSSLVAFGGLTGLGTPYWENSVGLKKAGALFAAESPEAARALVRRLGITHLVLFSWDGFEVAQARLYRGLPETAPLPADLFIVNLMKAPVPPPWLRPIPFPLPEHVALQGQQVRIWEVTPDQSPAVAAAHAANYHLELGRPDIAERFAPLLAGYPDDLAATVMLAGICSRRTDAAGFAPALDRVIRLLPQADTLSLDDQVHLVVVLAVGQRPELARAQLQSVLRTIDERSLRHLTPGALSDLVQLTEAFGVAWPDPALSGLARSLVPPNRRGP